MGCSASQPNERGAPEAGSPPEEPATPRSNSAVSGVHASEGGGDKGAPSPALGPSPARSKRSASLDSTAAEPLLMAKELFGQRTKLWTPSKGSRLENVKDSRRHSFDTLSLSPILPREAWLVEASRKKMVERQARGLLEDVEAVAHGSEQSKDDLAFLRSCCEACIIFEGLHPAVVHAMFASMERREYESGGEILSGSGEAEEAAFCVVASGTVAVELARRVTRKYSTVEGDPDQLTALESFRGPGAASTGDSPQPGDSPKVVYQRLSAVPKYQKLSSVLPPVGPLGSPRSVQAKGEGQFSPAGETMTLPGQQMSPAKVSPTSGQAPLGAPLMVRVPYQKLSSVVVFQEGEDGTRAGSHGSTPMAESPASSASASFTSSNGGRRTRSGRRYSWHKADRSKVEAQDLEVLGRGKVFGMMSVLNPGVHQLRATATSSKVVLWKLRQSVYAALKARFEMLLAAQKQALVDAVHYFHALPDDDKARLIDALEARDFAHGQTVLGAGAEVKEFFVVQAGQLAAHAGGGAGPGAGERPLFYDRGHFFGHGCLAPPPDCQVTAVADTRCFAMDMELFEEVVGPVGRMWEYHALRAVPVLAELPDAALTALLAAMAPRAFAAGEFVFGQGEGGQGGAGLVLVESGAFALYRASEPAIRHREAQAKIQALGTGLGTMSGQVLGLSKDTKRDKEEDRNGLDVLKAQSLSRGGNSGCLNLVCDIPWSQSMRCESDVGTVLEISRESLCAALGDSTMDQLAMTWRVDALRKLLPGAGEVEEGALRAVAAACSARYFKEAADVALAAQAARTMLLVESGTVTLLVQGQKISTLFRGAYVAEQALVGPYTHPASIRSEGAVLLCIDGAQLAPEVGAAVKESVERAASVGQRAVQELVQHERQKNTFGDGTVASVHSLQELLTIEILGCGSYGRVTLVTILNDPRETPYALKCVNKQSCLQGNFYKQLNQERELLLQCRTTPWVVGLHCTFRDADNVYMLMDCMLGGDLHQLMQTLPQQRLPERDAMFYAACTIMAIEYLHGRDMVHRDIKTENMMIGRSGYVKAADLGLAKQYDGSEKDKTRWKTYTTCGTPDYMAPEVYGGKGHNHVADLWSLGVLIFELVVGETPWMFELDEAKQMAKIMKGDYTVPAFVSQRGRSLLHGLMTVSPGKRLGNLKGGLGALKKHLWFEDFDWQALSASTLQPPFCPSLSSALDTSYFQESIAVAARKGIVNGPDVYHFERNDFRRNSKGKFDAF